MRLHVPKHPQRLLVKQVPLTSLLSTTHNTATEGPLGLFEGPLGALRVRPITYCQ